MFWFGGDFNIPDIDWKNQDIPGTQYTPGISSLFLELSQDLGLSQIIDFPTRGLSILDLFFTNYPHLLKKCYPHAGLGEHEVVKIETSLRPPRKNPSSAEYSSGTRLTKQNLNKTPITSKLNSSNPFRPKITLMIFGNTSSLKSQQ